MNTTIGAVGPRPDRVRPYLVLVICCMSLLVVSMDATIVNVALPALRRDLSSSTAGLQWVIDSYTLVVASLLMMSGSLADRFGRRRTFQIGLAVFTLASVLCSAAPGLKTLIAFRMLQAVGASMLNPVAMSIVTNTFLDPKARARAIGIWSATIGVSMAIGPLVGGALTQAIGWRSIFYINLPLGVAAILLARKFIPESKAPHARRVDPVGQILVLAALASVTYGVIEGPHHGWTSPLIVGMFAVTVASVIGILVYEPRQAEPLIDLRFFRSVPFTSATVIAVCTFCAFSGYVFLNALYLQEVRHFEPFETGLYTLPVALATIVCAPLSGRLVGRYGTRPSLLMAGASMGLSTLLMTRLDAETPMATMLVAYVLFGIGFGLVNAPITNTAVSGMPRTRAGLAAAITATSRQVGGALGVAIGGTIASSAAIASVGGGRLGGRSVGPEFPAATHAFWWLATAAGLAIVGLALLSTSRWAKRSTERIAALLDDAPEASPAAVAVAGGAR